MYVKIVTYNDLKFYLDNDEDCILAPHNLVFIGHSFNASIYLGLRGKLNQIKIDKMDKNLRW